MQNYETQMNNFDIINSQDDNKQPTVLMQHSQLVEICIQACINNTQAYMNIDTSYRK